MAIVGSFDVSEFPCQVGAEIRDFNAEDYMDVKDAKRSDRFAHLACAATQTAVQDAQFKLENFDCTIIASGIGGVDTIQKQTARFHKMGPFKVSPFIIPSLICNMAAGVVMIQNGFKGPNFAAAVTACSSSTHAFEEAFHLLQVGKADAIFAGGIEASLVGLSFCGILYDEDDGNTV